MFNPEIYNHALLISPMVKTRKKINCNTFYIKGKFIK